MEILRRETDYGLRAMVALAQAGGLVPTRRLAAECGVTLDYIRKIMPKFTQAGLVESVRGSAGGFKLKRAAGSIRFDEIVTAIQGPLVVNICTGDSGYCDRVTACPIGAKVEALQKELDVVFSSMTLEELMKK